MKKKILIIAQNFYPEFGSASNRITNLAKELADGGFEVDVLTAFPVGNAGDALKDNPDGDFDNANVRVFRLEAVKNSKVFKNLTRIRRYMDFYLKSRSFIKEQKGQYDLVIASSPQLMIGLSGCYAKKKNRCPFIFEVRDLWPESIKALGIINNRPLLWVLYKVEQYIMKQSDKICVNSRGFIPYISKKGHEDKVFFVPNFISRAQSSLRKSYKKPTDGLRVIFAGNIGYAQRLENLLKTARETAHIPDITYTIVGSGVERRHIKDLTAQWELTNVKIMGSMPREKALKFVLKHDVCYVHLSGHPCFETVFPGKMIDWMGMGMATVAGVAGYPRNVLVQSGGALIFDPGDHIAAAKHITMLYEDKSRLAVMGQNAFEYARENFDAQTNAARYINTIQGCEESAFQAKSVHFVHFFKRHSARRSGEA